MEHDFEKFKQETLEEAKQDLFKNGDVSPKVYLFYDENQPDGKISLGFFPLAQVINDTEQKIAAFEIIKEISKEKKAFFSVFVSEAWTSHIDKKDINKPRVEPRFDPNRREVLLFTWETNMESRMAVYEIIRDKEEKVTGIEFISEMPAEKGGRIVDIIEKSNPANIN